MSTDSIFAVVEFPVRPTIQVLSFAVLLLPLAAFAQNAAGEFNQAMDGYKKYDYVTACRHLANFYAASHEFREIPAEVGAALRATGKNKASLNQNALQAENAHEPARACSEHYLRGIMLAMEQNWSAMPRVLKSAEKQREEMQALLEPTAPPTKHPEDDLGEASMPATVAKNSPCASDDLMRKDAAKVKPCVTYLLQQARKQRSQGKLNVARMNFQRAEEVNEYLGAKRDPQVTLEVTRALRQIGRTQSKPR